MKDKEIRFRNNERRCRLCGNSMKPIGKYRHDNGHHSWVYKCNNKGCEKKGEEVLRG